ncbi:hypothetical protein SAMN05216403_104186 [Nitrosospira multiformis ATCC 25196]|uniref:Uncharacterized protein n=1 Tax=Nitrosospira multiformis (strain ATCC 25196 / NCIMB 11849 / C 71) TaxID=323848 RepID=A0A1H5THQ7_NITMU|nr:hypothetical protein SAMN05216403_104186 [Nitrosospira multiformis ATCC 25196]
MKRCTDRLNAPVQFIGVGSQNVSGSRNDETVPGGSSRTGPPTSCAHPLEIYASFVDAFGGCRLFLAEQGGCRYSHHTRLGLVVNPGAKIGNNVTLFHGVTLG